MSVNERKTWEREQRKNRIIDIAQRVFFQQGAENATFQEIANAAGYHKRTLYLYFKDKDELFLAVVLRGLKLLKSMLDKVSSDSESKTGILRKLGEAFFNFSLDHPDYLKLIMLYESNTCIYYKALTPVPDQGFYLEACQKATDSIADIMTDTLAQAIADGSIQTDLTPTQMMLLLWGQVFGVMQIILMRKEHFKDAFGISYHQLFDSFMDQVEKSLTP